MPTTDTNAEEKKNTRKPKDAADVMSKVRDLAALALSDDEEEARTAAVQAIRLLKKHEIVMLPKTELERLISRVEGAAQLEKVAKQEKLQNILMGALGGMLFGSKLKL